MSGPSKAKTANNAIRGVSSRMIKNRALEKDFAGGRLRASPVNLSTGMPGLVGLVRKTLKDKDNSVEFREGFLKSLDKNKLLRKKIETFFYTYQWRFNVTFNEDILLAIKEGALGKDIRSKLPNLFPKIAEKERRAHELAIVRKRYERTLQRKVDLSAVDLFFTWVLENWDYLCGQKYTHKGRPPENGLFFFEPVTPVKSATDLNKYLVKLYMEFRHSLNRLRKFGGVTGGATATVPTVMYQQLKRWIALDSNTRIRGKRLSAYKDYRLLSSFPEQLKDLTQLIDTKKIFRIRNGKKVVWEKKEIWREIKRYLKEHNIPQVCK